MIRQFFTFVLSDIVAREPACGLSKGALPPPSLFLLCDSDDIPFLETQLIIIFAFEGVDCFDQATFSCHLSNIYNSNEAY